MSKGYNIDLKEMEDSGLTTITVYDLMRWYGMKYPEQMHAFKKLTKLGNRSGGKSTVEDAVEVVFSMVLLIEHLTTTGEERLTEKARENFFPIIAILNEVGHKDLLERAEGK